MHCFSSVATAMPNTNPACYKLICYLFLCYRHTVAALYAFKSEILTVLQEIYLNLRTIGTYKTCGLTSVLVLTKLTTLILLWAYVIIGDRDTRELSKQGRDTGRSHKGNRCFNEQDKHDTRIQQESVSVFQSLV